MKIAVLGGGALGCVIGAALTGAGSDVWIVGRSAERAAAMNASGLLVREGEHERIVHVRAASDAGAIGVVDVVVVVVKAFDTEAAIESTRSLFGQRTIALTLQNGLGSEEILARLLGTERVIAGRTYVGGTMLGPARVAATVRGRDTYLGELDGSTSDRAVAVATEFERAGLATTVRGDITTLMWDKLLVNVATGALSAITRLEYGRLYQVPEIEGAAIAAVGEAMAVAHASGVPLSTSRPEDAWRIAAEGMPAEFKASMLTSLESGSVTEIDFVNGAVVRLGQRWGVATPVNRVLVACVKGLERGLARQAGE